MSIIKATQKEVIGFLVVVCLCFAFVQFIWVFFSFSTSFYRTSEILKQLQINLQIKLSNQMTSDNVIMLYSIGKLFE